MSFKKTIAAPILIWKILRCRLRGQLIAIGSDSYISPFATLAAGSGKITLGKNALIQMGAIISTHGGEISIGDNVSINPYSILYGHGGIKIGNDVRIAAHVVIVAADHIFESRNKLIRHQGLSSKGIEIGNDVWIASGAKILDGAKIVDGCVIGANAVVGGITEPYSVYVGAPAKKIKERV